jgi:hypothetical protein
MNKKSSLILAAVFALSAYACYAPENWAIDECDPDGLAPSKLCMAQADAGVDADAAFEADAGEDALDDPGFDAASMAPPNNCKAGLCLPVPTGPEAGLWSDMPLSLWVGPAELAPLACPDDPFSGVPNLKFRLFDKLVAPPATCSSCACGPSEGTCKGVPEKLELRAGKCNQSGVATIPFEGPANWNGLCSNDDTIAAGAKCPAGSQTLCTQSVSSSALPLPADEACLASASAPQAALETKWDVAGVACYANTAVQTCGSETLIRHCVNSPGGAWLQCVYRAGVHEMCPEHYTHRREVLYPEAPIDTRGCSACTCGAPMGSVCTGTLGLYGDSACGVGLINNTIASTGDSCFDLQPPGLGIGSKAISNLTYLPGTCEASGGASVGSATPDVAQAVTFCCMEPIEELEPLR